MTHVENQNLFAPTSARKPPVLPSQVVDPATALELRRTTRPTATRDKRCPRPLAALDFSCPPTIRTRTEPESSVPVVMVPPAPSCPASSHSPQIDSSRIKLDLSSRIKLDLSWLTAAFVALTVTGALAIPLELLRQHG